MYRLVTCPETAHLELIDYEDTPLGMLIRECSRFRPACAITCTRTCAARFDQAAGKRDAVASSASPCDTSPSFSLPLRAATRTRR